ncbi:hypothetical protein HQ394_04585 [Defluviicoccus vanus]|uniref:Uncharacterized protein n=2 Tax=Defluviicoccus vanus TaxID=111831 RepID=A0A7H1MZ87_9PROT|nr:hypothetical protein HQ394_04585 [Defluviicoccus vanus]
MLWKMARQTLIAAAVIGALAAVWQLSAGPGMFVSPDSPTWSERVYHDDD